MINAVINGVGSYLPEKVLDNLYFEKIMDTSDEWITTRTGIKERRIAGENEYTSDIASEAANIALKNSGLSAEDVDMIIVSTITPDSFVPSTASIVQKNIGAVNAVAFDLNAACTGFIYASSVAEQFIKCGTYKNVLVIGADTLSKITDYSDRNTCVLFGDGAGAVIYSASEDKAGILGFEMGANGSEGKSLTCPSLKVSEVDKEVRGVKDHYRSVWMDGPEVFKFAVKIMADTTVKIINKLNLSINDIKLIVPHQANIRIVDGALKRLKLAKDKAFVNLQKYGNMSAASIPVALCEAISNGLVSRGDKILLVGFGGGLTWGATVIEY